ncbi:MAG: alpha/beta hydrolase [Deltaproteobacteria bacterium]|uniref:Alpha/beta hydrolase n=1 Tax=Candidatus Zymogenus saltonus TaxID=2844893 RepID=A0A9D8KG46_9DELT|nr:alpha/beta hydrolase [Candidatus Zymogenus saltonus]
MKEMMPKKKVFETPILFVHGAWHGDWCWQNFMEYFSKAGFSCYALELPGHGERREEAGLKGKTMMDYVREIEATKGKIGNPIIVGHSMGGFATMKYLERNKAPAAVLVAPATFRRLPTITMIKMIFQYPIEMIRLTLLMPVKVKSEKMYRHLFLYNAPKKVSEEGFKKSGPESSLALLGLTVPLVWLRPKRVSSPVLLLASGHDYFFPPRNERRTARAYKADFKLYKDIGHNLMTENGWEDVAGDILEWLKKKVK